MGPRIVVRFIMRLYGPISSGPAVGANGEATANKDSSISLEGYVVGVYVDYKGSPPAATTDVTVKTKGTKLPSYNILKLTNGATNGLYLPRKEAVTDAGAAASGIIDVIPVFDFLNVLIEGANADDYAEVYLLLE